MRMRMSLSAYTAELHAHPSLPLPLFVAPEPQMGLLSFKARRGASLPILIWENWSRHGGRYSCGFVPNHADEMYHDHPYSAACEDCAMPQANRYRDIGSPSIQYRDINNHTLCSMVWQFGQDDVFPCGWDCPDVAGPRPGRGRRSDRNPKDQELLVVSGWSAAMYF